MHEVGIMQNTLAMAEQQARAAGASQIHLLRMRIGRLSGVVTDALEFAFNALKRNSMASEAALEIEDVVPACWCATCKKEFEVDDFVYICPECDAPSTDLRRGRELELASLEIS